MIATRSGRGRCHRALRQNAAPGRTALQHRARQEPSPRVSQQRGGRTEGGAYVGPGRSADADVVRKQRLPCSKSGKRHLETTFWKLRAVYQFRRARLCGRRPWRGAPRCRERLWPWGFVLWGGEEPPEDFELGNGTPALPQETQRNRESAWLRRGVGVETSKIKPGRRVRPVALRATDVPHGRVPWS